MQIGWAHLKHFPQPALKAFLKCNSEQEFPVQNPLFMYFVDEFKQENVLQDVFKQLIVPVNQKYIKKQKNEKKKISCFKL